LIDRTFKKFGHIINMPGHQINQFGHLIRSLVMKF